ncbi:MAG: hypothetical protein AB9860_03470 [Methanomassiliicoccales archaeon]
MLRTLREIYPAKVEELVLIAAVQKELTASIEQIDAELMVGKAKGFLEEYGDTDTEGRWFKITSRGIERLQELELVATSTDLGKLMEMERRLVETYDRIQADMSKMRSELDERTEAMNSEMEGMSKRIGDHDQVIRTYFIRVIETFGVFVGIFAIVVVMMLTRFDKAVEVDDPAAAAILVIGTPAVVVVAILIMLMGIKYLILLPDRR